MKKRIYTMAAAFASAIVSLSAQTARMAGLDIEGEAPGWEGRRVESLRGPDGENILHFPAEISSNGRYRIPASAIQWELVTPGAEYSVGFSFYGEEAEQIGTLEIDFAWSTLYFRAQPGRQQATVQLSGRGLEKNLIYWGDGQAQEASPQISESVSHFYELENSQPETFQIVRIFPKTLTE